MIKQSFLINEVTIAPYRPWDWWIPCSMKNMRSKEKVAPSLM